MDDISRESSPELSGAAPVSERQKGPEELVRFERGHVGEADAAGGSLDPEHRLHLDSAYPPADGDRTDVSVGEEEAMSSGSPTDDPELPPEEPALGSSAPSEDAAAEAAASRPDEVDAEAARAAVDAEASTASIEQDLDELIDSEIGDDGLPVVPELVEIDELSQVLFVMMLSSREGMTIFRLAQACNTTQKLVESALDRLQERLQGLSLPVELARVGDSVRWMSAASTFPYLQRLKGVKKLEKLSPAALETLAVIAYRQPVMRSEIEAIRGVKAGPMLRTLLQHKLVSVAGRADVPGRPLQYGTTPHFLERFGLASLQDLPSVKEWKNLG
jgi:segregation and condensation protein B